MKRLFLFVLLSLCAGTVHAQQSAQPTRVPILLYHRLGPTKADSMTVTTPVFESHLKYLKEHGYTVIPLRQLVNWLRKQGPVPPAGAVVIVEDDAHSSVQSVMLPLAKKYRVPVTVFVYPSAISNAKYAMTWDQLRELKSSGLFDIQSHTFWHPDFRREKKRLKPAQYEKLVDTQLRKSRERLKGHLGGEVDMLAWPYGIYNDYLLGRAAAAGYTATFTIEPRHVVQGDSVMALPRYLVSDADRGEAFVHILTGGGPKRSSGYP